MNVDIVRSLYIKEEACKDLTLCYTKDVVFFEPASLPYGGTHRGIKALSVLFDKIDEFWSDIDMKIQSVEEIGTSVLVRGRFRAIAKQTGLQVDEEFVQIQKIRDNRWCEIHSFLDTGMLLQALNIKAK